MEICILNLELNKFNFNLNPANDNDMDNIHWAYIELHFEHIDGIDEMISVKSEHITEITVSLPSPLNYQAY